MNEKKYQVFISSTYIDLKEERRKVLDILLMADCIPAGMEAFVATDDEQFEVIKKVIDLCDYYVLIIGKRYGSINPSSGKSYTEMEYEYAKEKGIPVLVFVLDDSVTLPSEKVEQELQNIEKLSLFRSEAMKNRLASIWKNSEELTGQVAIAIMRAQKEMIRPGWQRATDFDEASLRRETMEAYEKIKELERELSEAQEKIQSFVDPQDIAFDDCAVELEYHNAFDGNRISSKKVCKLPEVFLVIGTEMLDVSIVEKKVELVIIHKLIGSDRAYRLDDNQLVKRILLQLQALKLVKSYWSSDNKNIYWGLTEKGKKVRNDMILVKNKASETLEQQI